MNTLLLISLLSGALYNFDNSIVRLVVLSLWIGFPIIILGFLNKKNICYKTLHSIKIEILIAIVLYIGLFSCWLYSSDTLVIGFSGATGEMITPFLYFFHIILISIVLIMIDNGYIKSNILYNFYVFFIIILFIDMLLRYFQDPSLFMNYNERFSAKNTGLFVNTNVLGQSIAFMIVIAELVNMKNKRIIQIILLLILFTTMARSAIIALFAVYIFSLLWKQRMLYKIIAIFIGCINIFVVYFLFNSLNLSSDGSFLSKIEFVNNTILLIEKGRISNILFGFGASFDVIVEKLNVGEYSPHLSILKAFLYYGLIGVLFFVTVLYRIYHLNKKMLFPIITFLIFGLAGAPIYWPTLTVGLSILLINDSLGEKYDRY